MQFNPLDRWAIENTKTLTIVETCPTRLDARIARKRLNHHSYFVCDKGYRYRIVANPAYCPN